MSNDDHKKAPQSPEEMLAMIGKREDMVARGGDEGEDLPSIKETTEEEREELAQRKWPSGQSQTEGTEDDTENHDPLADLKEAYRELCGDVLPPSGYRTPEENEAAQDTADSEEDQDRCKGIPIDHVHISIDGQLVRPLKPSEPDADVMGYLHSRYGTEPQMRTLRELYDVRLSTVRLAFEPHDDDQWYYEIDAIALFDCGFVEGELSDACDHVDQIAREILQDDLTHF